MSTWRLLPGVLLGALLPTAVCAAQDTIIVHRGTLDASSRVARDAIAQFNRAGTVRFFGRTTIATDEVLNRDVGVFDGPLVVRGIIRGDVVAINADVDLGRTAEVYGRIVVLGGVLRGLDEAFVSGNTRRHRARVFVRRVGDVLELARAPDRRPEPPRRDRRGRSYSRASLELSLLTTYNRVEGLPIEFGPRFVWNDRRSPRLTLDAYGVFRTAGDFNNTREDLGYGVLVELADDDRSGLAVGARAYDRVSPIEDWQLSDREVGLAAFFAHRDYRDYYLQRGVSAFVRFRAPPDLTLSAEIARNLETSVAARDPWTPFRRDDVWQPNPRIDEGHFTSITARALIDTRRYASSRRSGFFLMAEWERGESDDVVYEPLPQAVRGGLAPESYAFHRLTVDVRAYERLGPGGQLRLRALGQGTVGDQPLPIQRRFSLGGAGSLPGFAFRDFTCGAGRTALCDRMVLFQAEYRGSLSFGSRRSRGRHPDEPKRVRPWQQGWDWEDWGWFDGPDLVLFADAGTGWIDAIDDRPGELKFDVGVGIEFGTAGVYVAKALQEGEPLRVRLRLERRF